MTHKQTCQPHKIIGNIEQAYPIKDTPSSRTRVRFVAVQVRVALARARADFLLEVRPKAGGFAQLASRPVYD
jgi:hypothetical protein